MNQQDSSSEGRSSVLTDLDTNLKENDELK